MYIYPSIPTQMPFFFYLLPLPSTLSFSFYTYRRDHMHSLHMLYATGMRREPGFGSGEREEQHRTAETINWGVCMGFCKRLRQ